MINHIASPIMSSLFEIYENTHSTRYFQVLSNESRRRINYGLETIFYRVPFLWANLPPEHKLTNSLNIFKRKRKSLKGEKLFFNTTKNKKSLNAQPFTAKKILKNLL